MRGGPPRQAVSLGYRNADRACKGHSRPAVQLNPRTPLVMGTWNEQNQVSSGIFDEVRLWGRALSSRLMKERADAFSER